MAPKEDVIHSLNQNVTFYWGSTPHARAPFRGQRLIRRIEMAERVSHTLTEQKYGGYIYIFRPECCYPGFLSIAQIHQFWVEIPIWRNRYMVVSHSLLRFMWEISSD